MSKKLILAVSLVVLFPLVVFSSQIPGDSPGQQDQPAPMGPVDLGQTPIALTGGRTLITYMYVNGVIARSFDTGTKSWTDYKDGRRDVIYQSGAEDNPTAQFFYVDGVLDHTVGEGGQVGFGNGATDDEGRAGTGRVTYYNKYGQEIRTEGFSIREGYFQHDDDKGGTGIYIGEPEYDDNDNLLNVLVTDLSEAFEWCIKEDNIVYDDYGRLTSKDTLVPDEFGDGELKWFTNVYDYDGSRLETITNSDVDGNVQYVIHKMGNTTEKTYLDTTVVIDRTVTNVITGRMSSTYYVPATGVEDGSGEYNNCNQLITKYDMDKNVTADYIYTGAHLDQILSYPNGKAPGEEGVLTNITQFDSYGNSFVYQTNAPDDLEPPAAGGPGLTAINTWTAEQLEALPGVGPTLAGNIIAYKEANGDFGTVDDLANVSGISADGVTLKNIKAYFTPITAESLQANDTIVAHFASEEDKDINDDAVAEGIVTWLTDPAGGNCANIYDVMGLYELNWS